MSKEGFDIEITCNHCGGNHVEVTLLGGYQVLQLDCLNTNCDNHGEESL